MTTSSPKTQMTLPAVRSGVSFCKQRQFVLVGAFLLLITACSPTVQVAPPSEPITINLNVKIEHEIKIKVEKELDELFSEDSDIF